jgi:glutamate transport system permease protein
MNPDLWAEMGPQLLPVFWVTIKLTSGLPSVR